MLFNLVLNFLSEKPFEWFNINSVIFLVPNANYWKVLTEAMIDRSDEFSSGLQKMMLGCVVYIFLGCCVDAFSQLHFRLQNSTEVNLSLVKDPESVSA